MRVNSGNLGLYVPGLGDFVDADLSAFLTSMGPNTGLGDFIGADDSAFLTSLAPSGLGDFVGADNSAFLTALSPQLAGLVPTAPMYPIPQNSVLTAYGLAGLGDHDDCGCGCGGSGGCGGGLSGISDTISSVTTWAQGQFDKIKSGDVATIALWGGGALLVAYLMFGMRSRGYRSATSGARAEYRKKVAALKAQYPTVYGRGRRAAAAF